VLPSLHLQHNHAIAKRRISFSPTEVPITSMRSVLVQQKFPSLAEVVSLQSSPVAQSQQQQSFSFSLQPEAGWKQHHQQYSY